MQNKRRPTLLAGTGLLIALTLSVGTLAGCTPSNTTPGVQPPAPPQTSGTNTDTPSNVVSTINGKADVLGKPFANADVKVVNLVTGSLIAAGGANLKTDAAGNFSVDVPGLAENDVVRVEVSADGKTMSALMTGTGLTTSADAPAGYAVTALTTTLVIDPTSTYMTHTLSTVMKLLQKNKELDMKELITGVKGISDHVKAAIAENPEYVNAMLGSQGPPTGPVLTGIAKAAGVVQLLTNTLTVAVQKAALSNADAVKALAEGGVSPAVTVKIEIVGNTIKIGDTVINTDTGTVVVDPPKEPTPVLTQEALEQKAEAEKGTWANSGNMNPQVTIGTNSVMVSQTSKQAQMTYLYLLLPKPNLTGASLANLSGAGLTGSVTGTMQNGNPRTGTLTFGALDTSSTGTVSLGTFGQIGTYTVKENTGAYEITMHYSFESGVQLVGAHSTTVTAAAVTLTKKDGMTIQISGDGASSRVQF